MEPNDFEVPEKRNPFNPRRATAGRRHARANGQAQAQIDPVPRQLLQLGVNSLLHDRGLMGASAIYYWVMPNVWVANQVLRFASAPVYVDGDYGFQGLLGSWPSAYLAACMPTVTRKWTRANTKKKSSLAATAAAVAVDYVDGTDQPGAFNSGSGTGISYSAPSRR